MFTVASFANLNAFRNAYPVNFRYSGLTRLPPGIRRQSLLKPDIGPEFSSASIHDGCGKSTRGRSSSRPSARIFRQLLGIIGFASFPLKPWTLWPGLAFMLNDRFAASAWMPALGRQEPVMNDCWLVSDWVARKRALSTDHFRCITEVDFGLSRVFAVLKAAL